MFPTRLLPSPGSWYGYDNSRVLCAVVHDTRWPVLALRLAKLKRQEVRYVTLVSPWILCGGRP